MLKNLFYKKVKRRNTRRFKRFRADFLVKYQVDGKGDFHITNARDISAGGLRFWSEEALREASVLNLGIYLPPLERTVEALAQVLRVRRARGTLFYYIAVRFLDLKQEDREALNEFSETLSRDKRTQFLIDHADIVIRRHK